MTDDTYLRALELRSYLRDVALCVELARRSTDPLEVEDLLRYMQLHLEVMIREGSMSNEVAIVVVSLHTACLNRSGLFTERQLDAVQSAVHRLQRSPGLALDEVVDVVVSLDDAGLETQPFTF